MDLRDSLTSEAKRVFSSQQDFVNHIADAAAADHEAIEKLANEPETIRIGAAGIPGIKTL